VAVHTHQGAQLAATRVQPHDLADPRARAIYQAATALPDTRDRLERTTRPMAFDEWRRWAATLLVPPSADKPLTRDTRIAAISEATGEPVTLLERLVADTPCMADTSGAIARAVLEARDERLRLAGLVDQIATLSEQLRDAEPRVFAEAQSLAVGWREATQT
jgi:hypothetical protein